MLRKIAIWTFIVLFVLAFIACAAIEVYVWLTYGNAPIDEIPAWALWFMFFANNETFLLTI